MNHYRLFTEDEEYMNYFSSRPIHSARKIFRKLCRKLDDNDFEFEIINTKTKKRYTYHGIRKMRTNLTDDDILQFKHNDEVREFVRIYDYVLKRIY